MYNFVSLKKDTDGKHKWVATIRNKETGREKRVRFGAIGYEDMTQHGDEERKRRYLVRHASNENWNDIYQIKMIIFSTQIKKKRNSKYRNKKINKKIINE